MSAPDLVKDVCRILGHEFPSNMLTTRFACERCNEAWPVSVWVDGVLQKVGEDFVIEPQGYQLGIDFPSLSSRSHKVIITMELKEVKGRWTFHLSPGERNVVV